MLSGSRKTRTDAPGIVRDETIGDEALLAGIRSRSSF